MIRVLVLQHEPDEWIGSMQHWFGERAGEFSLSTVRLDLGQTLPEQNSYDWLLIMGGMMSTYDEAGFPWLRAEKAFVRAAIEQDKTVLGICLGGQLIAAALGADVYPNRELEIGWFTIARTDASVAWLPAQANLLSWHGDCFALPSGATPFAASEITPCQGFYYGERVCALQFHLEADTGTVEDFLALEKEGLPQGDFIQSQAQLLNCDAHLAASRSIMYSLLDSLARH